MRESKWIDIFRQQLFRQSLCAVFIDEAHCIVQWGTGSATFRVAYAMLGDIRSFTKPGTPMVAMTATATTTVMNQIIQVCGMREVAYVVESPNRPNIRYSVCSIPSPSYSEVFIWLQEDLRQKGKECEKVLVFCRKMEDCVILYQSFATSLGDSSYVPAGECTLQNVLFGMFHAKLTKSDKDILLDSFTKSDGNCRVIFATIAFGMGVNIPDIHTIIQIGPSSSVDSYVQESGRAGRDGQQSHAIILLYPGALRGNVGKGMKAYCREPQVCRRITASTVLSWPLLQAPTTAQLL